MPRQSSRGTCSAPRRPTPSAPSARRSRCLIRVATSRPERQPPRVLGDVEIGFVQRERFDARRHRRGRSRTPPGTRPDTSGSQAGRWRGADRAGRRAPSASPSGRRTPAPRSSPPRRHPSPRDSPDRHRLPPQRRVVTLFHGRIEGVHVDVQDASRHLPVAVTSRQSPVVSHQSPVTSHQSPVVSRQSSVVSHASSVISHQSSVPSRQSPVSRSQTAGVSRQSCVTLRESLAVAIASRLSTVRLHD